MEAWVGTILPVAFNWAPEGWAMTQGQSISIHQNQVLFYLIGTTYGGDGKNTYNLPDLRGRVPVGIDGTQYRLADKGGAASVPLTTAHVLAATPETPEASTSLAISANTPTPSLDVRMPYLAVNFILCMSGVFPAKP